MKSKQDILKENYEKYFSVQKYDNSVTKATNEEWVCLAMDEYAREAAVHYAHEFIKVLLRNYGDTPPKEAFESFDKWVKGGFTFADGFIKR